MSTEGSKTVTVSYTEEGVTKTATYQITVTAKETPAKKKSGCGGSIAAASAIISVAALAGVGLFFIRRKEK